MEKKIAGLLGAMAALGTLNAAQAAPSPDPTEVLRADSYADLLAPIPNAAALLRAVDEAKPAPEANVEVAQYYYHHHHHHHHHHAFYPRYYAPYDPYGPSVVVVPRYRRYYHHHHHHHHHHSFYRRDY
jgi:hypothetical protein